MSAARIRERLRRKIAATLDHLPRTCWANLVSFALRSRRSPIQMQDAMCRSDLARLGTCYCGKLRSQGLDVDEVPS